MSIQLYSTIQHTAHTTPLRAVERATLSVDRLPVASTCFNTLKLPPYPSAQALAEKLRLVFWAEGFHEGAVAV